MSRMGGFSRKACNHWNPEVYTENRPGLGFRQLVRFPTKHTKLHKTVSTLVFLVAERQRAACGGIEGLPAAPGSKRLGSGTPSA